MKSGGLTLDGFLQATEESRLRQQVQNTYFEYAKRKHKLVARGVVLKGRCGVTVPFKALGV